MAAAENTPSSTLMEAKTRKESELPAINVVILQAIAPIPSICTLGSLSHSVPTYNPRIAYGRNTATPVRIG